MPERGFEEGPEPQELEPSSHTFKILITVASLIAVAFLMFVLYLIWKCYSKRQDTTTRDYIDEAIRRHSSVQPICNGACYGGHPFWQMHNHMNNHCCSNHRRVFTTGESLNAGTGGATSDSSGHDEFTTLQDMHKNRHGFDNLQWSKAYGATSDRISIPHSRDGHENISFPSSSREGRENISFPSSSGREGMENGDFVDEVCATSSIPGSALISPEEVSINDIGCRMFEYYPETPKELLIPTERSQIRTISNKLLVHVTKEVGYTGAVLLLDNMGISLTIPKGAIPRGEKQLIILVLNWDLSDNPNMTESQALVSPVVYCGPHGVSLLKPALLRYKHCAFDSRDIQIMQSQTELVSTKNWNLYCSAVEQEGKCKVSQDECQILLDHFTLFTSIQTPRSGEGKKWLQVAVFASPLRPGMSHHQFRIYFLNKTPCALEWAKHNESRFHAELACPEKVFLLRGSCEDVHLKLQYLSKDWAVVDNHVCDKIQYLKVWHGMCPYTAVCFSRNEDLRKVPKEINLNLSLFQESCENEADKIVIQMAESTLGVSHGFDEVNISSKNQNFRISVRKENVLDVNILDENSRTAANEIELKPRFVIPWELRRKLVMMLAPKSEVGSDWRDFGAEIGVSDIRFLGTLPCPTTALLDLFETKFNSLEELYQILERLERHDASIEVKMVMQSLPRDSCENTDYDSDY